MRRKPPRQNDEEDHEHTVLLFVIVLLLMILLAVMGQRAEEFLLDRQRPYFHGDPAPSIRGGGGGEKPWLR